jgi:hypothetical protein
MNTHQIALPPGISKVYAEELEKRLYFVSAQIERFRLVIEGENITGIELATTNGEDVENLAAKINRVIANEIVTQKILPSKVIWQHAGAPAWTG